MRFFIILVLVVAGCTSSEFDAVVLSDDAEKNSADAKGKLTGVIAEGFDYGGDPIVYKDPPGDLDDKHSYSLYALKEKKWQVNLTEKHMGSTALNGTLRTESITIKPFMLSKRSSSMSQISRNRYVFTKKQPGQASSSKSETFSQADRGILDILLVIDNSGSMSDEIKKVRENLSSLLSDVSGSNWQISMVKSDPHNTCNVEGKITADTAAYADEYKRLLTFNLQGGTEHMLKKARWALEGKSGTQCDGSWLRSDSTVAVVVVSDEPHQCPDNNHCSLSAYRSFVDAFSHQITTYGFTSWSATNQAIFSEHGSINSSSYASILQKISENIQAKLQDIFTLALTPDGKSITVSVDGTAIPRCEATKQSTGCFEIVTTTGESGSSSAVQFFNYTPPKAASITVDYTYGGIDFETSWRLDPAPLANEGMTVTVTKDGNMAKLASSDYTLSGDTLSVTSASIVPQGATLRVEYLENKALTTAFELSDSDDLPDNAVLIRNSAQVEVRDSDGKVVRTISSGFSFDGDTVTFDNSSLAPQAGIVNVSKPELLTVSYKYHPQGKSLETQYAFSKHNDHRPRSALSCYKKTGRRYMNCTHDDSTNVITIVDDGYISEGDEIVVEEQLTQQGNNISLVGTRYLDDEAVIVKLNGESCDVRNFIKNDIIMLENISTNDCALARHLRPDTEQTVAFEYNVYSKVNDGFIDDFLQMDENFFIVRRGKYKFEYWEVLLNDVRTNKFDVSDYKVNLQAYGEMEEIDDVRALGKDVEVKITVYLYHAL